MVNDLLIAIPTKGDRGKWDTVSEVFAKAATFTFVEVREGKVIGVKVEDNPARDLKQGSGPIAVKTLKDEGVGAIVAGELGPGATTLLEMNGIKMIKVDPNTKVSMAVEKALKMDF